MNPNLNNKGYYNYPSNNPFLHSNPNPYMQGKPQQGPNYQKGTNSPNKDEYSCQYENKFVTNVNVKSTMTQQDKVISFGNGRDENYFKQTLRKSYEPSVNRATSYNIITNLPMNHSINQKINERNKYEPHNSNKHNQLYYQQGAQRYNHLKANNDDANYNYQKNLKSPEIGPTVGASNKKEKIRKDIKEYYEQNCGAVKEYAYIEDQNVRYRNYMEDKGFGIDCFNNTITDALFGLFDGHGGVQVSKFLQENIPSAFKSLLPSRSIPQSLTTLFEKIDLQISKESFCNVGSTACLIYITNENNKKVIYSANVGDTRSLLISQFGFKRLSYDHRASDKGEHERIVKGGGVIFDGRLYGQLMLSRSIGDWKMKSCGLIATPFITRSEPSPDNRYVIIASDGVFDVLEDKDVYQISFEVNNANDYVKKIVKYSIAKGAVDNISCFAIKLN